MVVNAKLVEKLLLFFLRYRHVVFLVVFFNPASSIDQLLFSCVKGMAGRAYFNLQITNCRPRLKCISTGAGHCCHAIIGMYSVSHDLYLHVVTVISRQPVTTADDITKIYKLSI